jgi:hypothetical protein
VQRVGRGLDRVSMLHPNSKMQLFGVAPCRISTLSCSIAAVYSRCAHQGSALQPSAPGHLEAHPAVRLHSTCGPLAAEVDINSLPRHIVLLRHGHVSWGREPQGEGGRNTAAVCHKRRGRLLCAASAVLEGSWKDQDPCRSTFTASPACTCHISLVCLLFWCLAHQRGKSFHEC